MRALVVLAATVIPAPPLVILSPLVFPAPVFVFTPFLARSNGPSNIGHVKTGFARNGGCLKAFPEPNFHSLPRNFRSRPINGFGGPAQVTSVVSDIVTAVPIQSKQTDSHTQPLSRMTDGLGCCRESILTFHQIARGFRDY